MLKLCQYFGSAKGCKYGEKCNFSHSNHKSIPICKSFLLQKCRYAGKCKFSHTDSSSNSQTQHKRHDCNKQNVQQKAKSKICRVYEQNKCRYGNKCRFLHSEQTLYKENGNNTHRKSIKHTEKKQICGYGNKCKFVHSFEKNNGKENIQLENLGICLKYIAIADTPNHIISNTLYYYYVPSASSKYILFSRVINDITTEYHTDVVIDIDSRNTISEYCCGLIEGENLFIQQRNVIYKCMNTNVLLKSNKYVCKYKTIDTILLRDYENSIQLISDDYDIDSTYYTIHEICICNEYIMSFTLYVCTTNLFKITDIQIFDVSKNQMECVYHVNKYNTLKMEYMEKKLSFGQFYWFNKRALFYEEYNAKTGLGQFCVGWDGIDLYKSNRNILGDYLHGIDHLVDIVFQYVSTFNFIDKKRIIFKNIKNIQIDKSNAILYISYFRKSDTKKQMRKRAMHCYQILCK